MHQKLLIIVLIVFVDHISSNEYYYDVDKNEDDYARGKIGFIDGTSSSRFNIIKDSEEFKHRGKFFQPFLFYNSF